VKTWPTRTDFTKKPSLGPVKKIIKKSFFFKIYFFYRKNCFIEYHGKNGFVTATKLGTTNEFFVASTKSFAAATKCFVDRTKHFVVTKYFCYPYFN